MSHKDYPKGHCPLTGKICAKHKTLHVTEIDKEASIKFGLCQDCSETWASLYSKEKLTPVVKPEELTLSTLPDAVKEIADILFGQPPEKLKHNLPKITVSHDLTITPKLLQDAAMRVARKKESDLACKGCGTTLEEMAHKDRFGCAECYETFAKYVKPLLEGYHGSLKHKGKVPKNFENSQIEKLFPADEVIKYKIASLNDEKRDAIKNENFERAGEILKEVEELKNQLNEASSENEHSSDSSPQTDQSPPQKDEDQ
jgi:protein-arginine kinase activator protein McsA